MRAAIIDTETTGIDEEDQAIELGAVHAMISSEGVLPSNTSSMQIIGCSHTLIMPTVHVKPEARAAHHITDDELEGALTMDELLHEPESAPSRLRSAELLVGHNIEFDLRLLRQSGLELTQPYLCTWKLSLHLWPEAPGHSNQTLRYWLGASVPPLTEHSHRAIPDALVTAALLREMLRTRSLQDLLSLMGQPVLLLTCRIGKEWSGKPWSDVDEGMLRWILDPARTFDENVKYTAKYWLNQRIESRIGRRTA